jgi:hypothetical protein
MTGAGGVAMACTSWDAFIEAALVFYVSDGGNRRSYVTQFVAHDRRALA